MKKVFSLTNMVIALALIAGTICISSFRQDNTSRDSFRTPNQGDDDTTPPRKRNRDTDEFRIEKLEDAMKRIDIEMSKLDERLKNVDFTKVQKDVNEVMNKIDFDKIAKEVEVSINKADWNKMQADLRTSMEQVKNVDMVKVKEHLDKVKVQLDKEKMQMNFDAQKFKSEMGKSMENAKASIEKAKQEIKNMQSFTDALEKDGLIDKGKKYDIKVENGELYIDGKKQSKEATDKYRQYYRKDNFRISNGGRNNDWI